MATRLSAIPRRPSTGLSTHITTASSSACSKPSHTPLSHTPSRAATIIRRPRRPYTFTQLIQQTDGSTYTMRTTSPIALYKSVKDTRNHVLWQPSDSSLRNVEVDEAGKLAAFRERFGRGWDAEKPETAGMEALEAASAAEEGGEAAKKGKAGDTDAERPAAAKAKAKAPPVDALGDLISSYAAMQEPVKEPKARPSGPPKKRK
ncbi:hypothetical protein F5Y04DRAFT_283700 [Hypomontagnella monticulosa]|nr:hypothetical protein F5Y04DRAFT_283700 [Hypomontagnella monticulosa]